MKRKNLALTLTLFLVLMPLVFCLASCQSLPDGILSETDDYIIERKDGKCFLNFKNGNEKDEMQQGGCVVPGESIHFSSPDEMKDAFLKGKLDEDALFTIRNFFPRNEDDSIIVPDPENFFIPTLPSNLVFDTLLVQGEQLAYSVNSDDGMRRLDGRLSNITKGDFDRTLA